MTPLVSTRPVRAAMHRVLQRRLIPPTLTGNGCSAHLLDDALNAARAEHLGVLKVRPGTRAVHRVRHPLHGECVLKITEPRQRPGAGLAAEQPSDSELVSRYRALLVRDADSPIFPRIFEVGTFWTLEEFIDGGPFREWMDRQFRIEPVARYLNGLRNWATTSRPDGRPSNLPGWQVRESCRHYIDKCLRHSRYSAWRFTVRSFGKLLHRTAPIRSRIDRLDQAAATLSLPAGLMCGDMGNINLLVDRQTERVYNIDYEYLASGHWGFDGAYFLSSLAKLPHSSTAFAQIEEAFRRELAEEGDGVLAFFSLLTETLTEISTTVYGHNW